jgi:hypothetical protein
MEIQWRFNGDSMEIQWRFNGDAMEIQWRFNGDAMVSREVANFFALQTSLVDGFPDSSRRKFISPMKQVPQLVGCEVMSYNLMGWSSFNANRWKVPGVPLFFNVL